MFWFDALPSGRRTPVGRGAKTRLARTFSILWAVLLGSVVALPTASRKAPEAHIELDPFYLLPGSSRAFEVEYVAKINEVPQGTQRLRIWVPVPRDSEAQSIEKLTFSQEPRISVEPMYGNKIAYWEISNPPTAITLQMSFRCTRKEIRSNLANLEEDGFESANSFARLRQPDRLVTVDEAVRTLSNEITRREVTTLAKARTIYDYVLAHMAYAKTQPGWGTGSTRFACEFGQGNCTDFHALFISLCRAQGIASAFEIGLFLPYETGSNEPVSGYHCWAFFRSPGKTWVPVDCSEARRNPERSGYFFGALTSNRVALSAGRDIELRPKQDGPPLNYFVDPYAEADGRVVKTQKTWSFHDLD